MYVILINVTNRTCMYILVLNGIFYALNLSRYELPHAKYVTDLPKGKHSTKGVGMHLPDPKDNLVTEDGVIVPLGKGVDSGLGQSSLLYNEYPFCEINIYFYKVFFLFLTMFSTSSRIMIIMLIFLTFVFLLWSLMIDILRQLINKSVTMVWITNMYSSSFQKEHAIVTCCLLLDQSCAACCVIELLVNAILVVFYLIQMN